MMPDEDLGDVEWTEDRPLAQSSGWAMPGSPHKSAKKLGNLGDDLRDPNPKKDSMLLTARSVKDWET